MTKKLISLCGLSLVLFAGCSMDSDRDFAPGSVASFGKIPPDALFAASKRALKEYYRIDSVDKRKLIVRSVPEEYVSEAAEGTLADTLGKSKHTLRKIAAVRVRESEKGISSAVVRVYIQRRDTESIRAFAYQREAEDRPSEQSMEKISERGTKRAEVWSTIGRDYAQERKILDSIKEILDSTGK